MHRVELKDANGQSENLGFVVPNAPCGVERITVHWEMCPLIKFLMHRVELKALSFLTTSSAVMCS